MKDEEIKIVMMTAASHALSYKKLHPSSSEGEAITHAMKETNAKSEAKIPAVAAASKALQYKERTNMTDKEILRKVMAESDELIANSA